MTEKALRATPETIRALRTGRGWSTDELARRLGIPGSGSIVNEWEEGRRPVEGPIATVVLFTLAHGDGATVTENSLDGSIENRGEAIWRRSGNWRESWRQVSAVPSESLQIDASTFSGLFPDAALPSAQHVHGFPFVNYDLPRDVYGLTNGIWRGVIPQDHVPPAYLWLFDQSGAFLYREKIWEDDKTSITAGHIHIGWLLEICADVVFFLRHLGGRIRLSPTYRLALELNGMKGRGVVAQRDGLPSNMLAVDDVRGVSLEDRRSTSIEVASDRIASFPLGVVYELVAKALLDLRPDLARQDQLERQLRLRHAFDDRRGGLRFLGFLDDVLGGRPLRRAVVSVNHRRIGLLVETTGGSRFTYDPRYVEGSAARPLSPRMPVRAAPYETSGLLPFFENLLPEGAQLDIFARQRNLDPRDKFGILLATLPSSIGDVQIHQDERVETP